MLLRLQDTSVLQVHRPALWHAQRVKQAHVLTKLRAERLDGVGRAHFRVALGENENIR